MGADNLAVRLWAKVDKSGECWIWTGGISGGYGMINYEGTRSLGVKVAAWMVTFGPVPKGLNVLSHCDVKLCVNPEHLFLATSKEKQARMVANGNGQIGAKSVLCKLTDDQVRQIRERWVRRSLPGSGTSVIDLAREFGVSRGYIYHLCSGIRRKHVG